jgi:Uncharacterized protein conserved in bacteria
VAVDRGVPLRGRCGVGGWFLYAQISHKLASNKVIPVNYYVGMREAQARAKITTDGFEPRVNHHSSRKTAAGFVFRQDPISGNRIHKGDPVVIWVSTGVPKVAVPDLVGKQSTDAVSALNDAHLKPDVHEVASGTPVGQVTAQDPAAGTQQPVGSSVRINVSKGPTPVSVPGVVGEPIATATSALQAQGFKVSPAFVDSTSRRQRDQPEPCGGLLGGQGLGRQPHRLEGPEDVDRARRDEPRPRLGTADPERLRVRQPRQFPGHVRPEQRRARALAVAAGRDPAQAGANVTLTVGRYTATPPTTTDTCRLRDAG